MRVVSRALDYGTLGHYKYSAKTGSMAAGLAAAAPIYGWRWTDATRLAIVTRFKCDGMYTTTAFVAGQILFEMMVARGYSTSDTGGTALTLTGNNQKQRTSMGTTLVGDVRISSTATLTAGTRTLDANPHGQINSHSSAGVGGATPIIGNQFLPFYEFFEPDTGGIDHPLVFAQNEGFAIRATVPATGVWVVGFTGRHVEVASY